MASEDPRVSRDARDEDLEPASVRPTTSIPPPPAPSESTRSRWLLVVSALAVAAVLVVTVRLAFAPTLLALRARGEFVVSGVRVGAGTGDATAALVSPSHLEEAAATPAAPAGPRADDGLDRTFRSPILGGLLFVLPEFASDDGAFDLAIHFHGNTDLVAQGFGYSKLNAVLVTLNIGRFSGPYEDKMMVPGSMIALADRAVEIMKKRGLAGARVRRIAISSWSGGYGGVLRVIEQPSQAERVDALVMIDGIHVGYDRQTKDLDRLRLEPFLKFAREASRGNKLFSITHSEIIPKGFPSCRETTDAILKELGIVRTAGGSRPEMPPLPELVNVMSASKLIPLEPLTETRKNDLVIRGYAGDQAETHMLALAQMSTTGLPDLVKRWSKNR